MKGDRSALAARNESWRVTQGGWWAEGALNLLRWWSHLWDFNLRKLVRTFCQVRRSSVKVLAAAHAPVSVSVFVL